MPTVADFSLVPKPKVPKEVKISYVRSLLSACGAMHFADDGITRRETGTLETTRGDLYFPFLTFLTDTAI